MNTYTKEQIDEQFEKAPAVIRGALFAKETSDKIRTIGEKFKLHIDQIGALASEAGLVMLGLEPSVNFVKNLEAHLRIDNTTAENMALEVSSEVFLPIRESLKQIEENKRRPGADAPSPEALLKEIEHSTPAAPAPKGPSIFERKLAETVQIKPDIPVTIPTEPPPAKLADPYLEPVE